MAGKNCLTLSDSTKKLKKKSCENAVAVGAVEIVTIKKSKT